MKKILLLMSAILFATMVQARKPVIQEYKGIAVIDAGITVNGNRTLVDNAYKQHTLLKKANQWLIKNYDKDSILIAGETITLNTKDFRLFLEFSDGVFKYCFTDKMKDEKKFNFTYQHVMDDLVQYVRTCKLESNSW
jgi:hypothetical protein